MFSAGGLSISAWVGDSRSVSHRTNQQPRKRPIFTSFAGKCLRMICMWRMSKSSAIELNHQGSRAAPTPTTTPRGPLSLSVGRFSYARHRARCSAAARIQLGCQQQDPQLRRTERRAAVAAVRPRRHLPLPPVTIVVHRRHLPAEPLAILLRDSLPDCLESCAISCSAIPSPTRQDLA